MVFLCWEESLKRNGKRGVRNEGGKKDCFLHPKQPNTLENTQGNHPQRAIDASRARRSEIESGGGLRVERTRSATGRDWLITMHERPVT